MTDLYMYELSELVVANLLPLFPWYFHYASDGCLLIINYYGLSTNTLIH